MYQLQEVLAVKRGVNQRWALLSPNSLGLPISQLYRDYRAIQLKMALTIAPTVPLYLDFSKMLPTLGTSSLTIAQALTANANAALPTGDPLVLNPKTARYGDVFRLNYTVTAVNSANSDSLQIPLADKNHVRLTRVAPATNYQDLYKKAMITVNGFYHLTDTDNTNGIMVMDAMMSCRVSKKNQMGMLSFNQVANLTFVPIKAPMIVQDAPKQALVTLTQNLTNKTVFLVLGGYLHPVDPQVYTQVSAQSFRIHFENLPFLDRYFESKQYINLSSLGVTNSIVNPELVNLDQFYSDPVIKAYLLLSQSFFVILDTPQIYTQRQYVRRTGNSETHISYKEPLYPIVSNLGRHPEYWSVFEDNQYAIHTAETFALRRLFNTTQQGWLTNVDNSRVPHYSASISQMYFLEIGKDI